MRERGKGRREKKDGRRGSEGGGGERRRVGEEGREGGKEGGREGGRGRFTYYIRDTYFFAAWFNAQVSFPPFNPLLLLSLILVLQPDASLNPKQARLSGMSVYGCLSV